MSQFRDNIALRPVVWNLRAREVVRAFPDEVKRALGKAIYDLQRGLHLTMPLARPMPSVAAGVHELRVKDRSGIFRVFYVLISQRGVVIFHAFQKKSQKTPVQEVELGRRKLREVLNAEA